MTVSFHANCVAIEDMDEDEYWLVGFADEKFETKQYLMLQRGYFDDDEQDIKNGSNTYYVERDGQNQCIYGGIERFELYRDRLLVQFTKAGQQRLNATAMDISFKLTASKFDKLKNRLERVFAGTECLVVRNS